MNKENYNTQKMSEELTEYKRRLKKLSADKSQLQLYADLINTLSHAKGLDQMSYQIVSLLMRTLGGANITLYYSIDGSWHSMDASRKKTELDAIQDSSIQKALSKKQTIITEDGLGTMVKDGDRNSYFQSGSSWTIPLLVENEPIGVIKLEGMLIVSQKMMDHLKPFINYASLVLKSEIENYSELIFAYENIQGINRELTREIEVRKKAEYELQESENRFRSTFEHALIGMCLNAVNGELLMVNPAMCRMLGYSEAELLTKKFEDYTHPDDVALSFETIQLLLEGKTESAFFEKRYIQKLGTIIWAMVGTFLLRDAQQKPKYLITHVEDITSRKLAEEKLKANEVKFKTFFEHVTDYALVLEPTQKGLIIIDMNESACIKHGYTRQELIGKPITFLDIKPVPLDDERIAKVMSGESVTFEVIHKRKDGSLFPVESTSKLLQVEGVSYIFSIERDITDKKLIEEDKNILENQLRQSLKMEAIGTLAGGIAHDFNNILAPILGYTEMLQMILPQNGEEQGYLSEVLKSGIRAKELVKQILTFSRQAEHELKPLKIHIIIKEALRLLRSSIPSTIEIVQKIDTNCGIVLADPTQIHQIILNLCTNAYHAMRETGGVLAVSLSQIELETEDYVPDLQLSPGTYLKLEVSDTGHGMSPEVLEKVFDPYFTTKKKDEGTGMGLAIVHGIVNSHHGKITVYSKPAMGTTFHIYLPAIQSEPVDHKPKDRILTPTGNERVLVVDDEKAIAKMLKHMLVTLGYQVTTKTSSIAALTLFRSRPEDYDVVITDMTMPNMSGAELVQKIKSISSNIPIILCTGFSELISKEKAKSLGISKYLMKPVSRADLAMAVREVLTESKKHN